ncbi:uncharacterized protein TOT_030000764 [Theileria orientalis strain Shintoku]|uniref:RING-type domain-containing protein n=1 Tax=Theileria orientalis strain Shintoku TaxID=869250 RepID=J4CDP5_THEOR|nr:uncharacterized protein TOT_030000764 [Theileria orientalis strain Shintoku]BAM41502.1 uncharacterized protein TOT_030000764 [Theileria orientalis strain Shintoku]|eukprot:XP_009691803.1 uncharacterized protein TOT_030000764 [Theileria orientalis strain Shintoku]
MDGYKFLLLDKPDSVDHSDHRTPSFDDNVNGNNERKAITNKLISGNGVNRDCNGDGDGVTYVRRLHIGTNSVNTRELITQTLFLYKKNNKYVTEGLRLDLEGIIAIIIKCDPVGGHLSDDTIFYVEEGIKPINKIQLLWDIKNYTRLKQYVHLILSNTNGPIATSNDAVNNGKAKGDSKPSQIDSQKPVNAGSPVVCNTDYCLDRIIDHLQTGHLYYGPFKIRGIKSKSKPNSSLKLHLLNSSCDAEVDSTFSASSHHYHPIQSNRNGVIVGEDYAYGNDSDVDSQGYSILISLLFSNLFHKYLIHLLEVPRFYFYGNCQVIGDLKFFTSSIEPNNKPGYIDENTAAFNALQEIYLGFDPYDSYDKITVSPLKDTLPVNYRYNLLEECVRPYFRLNSFKLHRLGDSFYFSGIQFRITNVSQNMFSTWENDVDGDYGSFMGWMRSISCPKYGRVDEKTRIEIGEPVNTKLMDILSPERVEIVRRSAPCYRENLLLCFVSDLDLNSLDRIYPNDSAASSLNTSLNTSLNNSLATSLNNTSYCGSLLNSVSGTNGGGTVCRTAESAHQRHSIHSNNGDSTPANGPVVYRNVDFSKGDHGGSGAVLTPNSITRREFCTVCCETISPENNLNAKRLSCGHVFHKKCVLSWLKSNKSCPNCRRVLPGNATPRNFQDLTGAHGDPRGLGEGRFEGLLDGNPRDEAWTGGSFNIRGIRTVRRSALGGNYGYGNSSPPASSTCSGSVFGNLFPVISVNSGRCVSDGDSAHVNRNSVDSTMFQGAHAKILSIWSESNSDNAPTAAENTHTDATVDCRDPFRSGFTSASNSGDFSGYLVGNLPAYSTRESVDDIFKQYEDFENFSANRFNGSSRKSSTEDTYCRDWEAEYANVAAHVNGVASKSRNGCAKETDALVNWRIMVNRSLINTHSVSTAFFADATSGPSLDITDLNSSDDSNPESDLEEYFNTLTS